MPEERREAGRGGSLARRESGQTLGVSHSEPLAVAGPP